MSMNLVLFVDGEEVSLRQTRTDQTHRVLALPKEEQFEAYLQCLLEFYVDKHSKIPRTQVIDILQHAVELSATLARSEQWQFDMT